MRRAFFICFALACLTGLVFALAPQLDVEVAGLFYANGQFIGQTPAGVLARKLGILVPALVLGAALLVWAAGRLSLMRPALPGRSAVFLTLAMAIGPGLIVNLALKDHSHRPRPVQVRDFGGSQDFRPWYRLDGDCTKNCSFVSGEMSSAVWLVAPALLAAPPLQAIALAGAGVFAVLVGTLRMAFGGHFLSDVLMSGFLTLMVIFGLFGLLRPTPHPRVGRPPEP